jgi:uncharacterized membrane protein YdbT with pleckstrin-like domain
MAMEANLIEGEEVVFSTTKHWAAPLADSKWAILMIIGAFALGWFEPARTDGLVGFIGRIMELLRLGLFFGGVGWIVYNIVAWRTAELRITNLRVLGQQGLVRSRSTDTLLSSIADVRSRASAVGRMLGYGDVQIFSASGEAGADAFTTIRNAEQAKKVIFEQKTRREAAGMPSPAPAATAPATQSDAMATLESLGRLRDTGVITAEEFEAKKAELLTRI